MSMRKPINVQSLRSPTASVASEPRPEASVEPAANPSGGSPADDAAGESSAATAAAVAAVNGMEAVERVEERGGKKSAAFCHTRFHRLVADARGKEFERRMCRYCDAVFSFKGGTTSAALRHLKAAHPERMLAVGSENPRVVVLTQQQMQQQMQLQQQQLLQRQLQQVGGAVDRQADGQQEQQTTNGETASNGDSSSVSDAAIETVAAGGNVLNVGGGDSVVAEASTAPTDEDVNYYARKERKLRSILKRKRESGSFDVDAASRAGSPSASDASAATAGPSTPQKGTFQPSQLHAAALQGSPPQLTASQVAITHFLQHYKDALPVSVRLQLARHLTHNVSEAEMYNVLDDATRTAYVREFAAAVGGDNGNRDIIA
jgi:hypothetical protein